MMPASSNSLRCCLTASLSLGCMGLGRSLKGVSLFNLIWCFTAVAWPWDMSSRAKTSGMDLSFPEFALSIALGWENHQG